MGSRPVLQYCQIVIVRSSLSDRHCQIVGRKVSVLQILDAAGRLVGEAPDLDDKDLVEMYRLMALGRRFDRRAMNLQRQGRLGTFPPGEGQEATQIGSAYAIGPEDWIYPSYREHAVQLARACLRR